MDSIEIDNIEKINKYKNNPPSPSYIAGLVDGDGCIFIRKIKDGYQSGISLTQCRTNILQIIRYHFGGTITSSEKRNNKTENIMNDKYYDKFNKRNQYNLLIRSNEYSIILNYIKDFIIIKKQQMDSLYEFSKLVNLTNKLEEKEKLYSICSASNIKNDIFNINFSKINIEYIQGIFDAEGCIYINSNKSKYRVSIVQKNCPKILDEIQKILGFGIVKEKEYKIYIYSKCECLQFISLMKPGCIIKYNQLLAFETFLITKDKNIKEEMYLITNREKHKIENFKELNKNEIGKNEYMKTIEIKNNLQNVFKELKIYMDIQKQKKNNKIIDKTQYPIKNKNSVSDDIILQVREFINVGHKNIFIESYLNLPRHTITRIKNGDIICSNEEKKYNSKMSQEQLNISKRKISIDEIFIVLEKLIKKEKYTDILDYLCEQRSKNNIINNLNIYSVRNIKRYIEQNKKLIYESEVTPEKYNYYNELLKIYNTL